MPIQNAIAALPVASLDAALSWYARLFGRQPDSRPMPTLAEWHFPHGGWLQLFQTDDARLGHGSVTLAVASLEEQMDALKAIGLDPGQQIDAPAARVVMLKDPDGNSLAFAQALGRPGMAR